MNQPSDPKESRGTTEPTVERAAPQLGKPSALRNPVRNLALGVLALLAVMLLYHVASNRVTPYSSQLGVVLAEQGKVREGRTAILRALTLTPKHEFSLRQLARLSREEKDYESELNFLSAIDKPDHNDVHSIGNAYFNQRYFREAMKYYHLSSIITC